MGIPQIIIAVILGFNLVENLCNYCKEEIDRRDFWITVVSTCLTFGLLKWGGFY